MTYEYLEHPADIGIKICSETYQGLYADAAQALFNIMYDPHTIAQIKRASIAVQSSSHEYLLVDFLNELISVMDVNDMFAHHIENLSFKDTENEIVATCEIVGEECSKNKHLVKIEVKAATYSGLSLKKEKNNIVFKCLFDV